ncbi:short-chain dehydrogenase [uncultured Dokdonia sp.]|uniref:short-chain dehydrogenase n=1 Tax=uncultured Dokdonia sp. TaxID=575653 RepID=UPI0026069AAF|nr:short-chain dehydrogenase [uncultured Dokdonia sp.]
MRTCLLFFFTFILSISCSNKEETDIQLLEKDKKQLVESLDAYKVSSYKFGKILIRASIAEDTISKDFQDFKTNFQEIFDILMKHDHLEESSLSILDYIKLYRDYKKVEGFIIETDEDIFPTLTEVFMYTHGGSTTQQPIYFEEEKKINIQNTEHAILSAIVLLSKDLGKEISLYECSKTNPESLPDSEIKTLLQYYRGFLFFDKELYYLSENEITRNIHWLNKNKEINLPYTRALFQWGNLDNQKTHTGLHALNHVFRGFDRLRMDREIDEKRALEDFAIFLEDANQIGLNNEITWSIETYLYLKNEEHEKAISSLTKLKASTLLSSKDKNNIDQSIEYLKNRESGKVLNGVYDKYFLGKIATKYMFSILSQVDWKKFLEEQEVPHTNEMFETIDRLKKFLEDFDTYTSAEQLKESGEKLRNKGENLWDKAKGLVE